MSEVKFKTSSL